MALYTVDQLRDLGIGRDEDDTAFGLLVDECEALITARGGANYDSSTFETHTDWHTRPESVALPRYPSVIHSITADGTTVTLANTQVRHGRMLYRDDGARWSGPVVVQYLPIDDTNDRRRRHLQLVRLFLTRTELDQFTNATITVQPRNVSNEIEKILRGLIPPRL